MVDRLELADWSFMNGVLECGRTIVMCLVHGSEHLCGYITTDLLWLADVFGCCCGDLWMVCEWFVGGGYYEALPIILITDDLTGLLRRPWNRVAHII